MLIGCVQFSCCCLFIGLCSDFEMTNNKDSNNNANQSSSVIENNMDITENGDDVLEDVSIRFFDCLDLGSMN